MILKLNNSKTKNIPFSFGSHCCVCVCGFADISPETHMLLEHALCGHELHGFAVSTTDHICTFLTFAIMILTYILL